MTISTGDPAPAFSLPDAAGGTAAFEAGTGPAVVVFTCNHCPYALAWHQRINDVARAYGPRGVRFFQVSSNDAGQFPLDSFAGMQRRVQAGEFATPYLHDASQDVARAYGARVTPDVFVFDGAGKLAYRGAPDADYADPQLEAGWLRTAIDEVLAAEPVGFSSTEPVGCSIKWRS